MSRYLQTGTHTVRITGCDRQSDVDGDSCYLLTFEKRKAERNKYSMYTRYIQTKRLLFNFKFSEFVAEKTFGIDPRLINNSRYIRSIFLNKIVNIKVVENKVGDKTYYNVSKFNFIN